LHPLLQKLKVDTLIVVGIYTDLCVAHTIGDAYQWGYKIIIPKDATNTFTKQKYLASLKYFKENYNAQITTVDEIVKKDLTWNEN
jgi:nicotinamidase-related amidase